MHVNQSSFKEYGGGVLDLKVHGKGSDLLRSELGLGVSYYYNDCIYLYGKFSCTNESRFCGKKTVAYFNNNPTSEFDVYGVFPQNIVLCDNAVRYNPICETAKVNVAYHGEFGSRLTSNEVSAALSIKLNAGVLPKSSISNTPSVPLVRFKFSRLAAKQLGRRGLDLMTAMLPIFLVDFKGLVRYTKQYIKRVKITSVYGVKNVQKKYVCHHQVRWQAVSSQRRQRD